MASSKPQEIDIRTSRLNKFFYDVLNGKRELNATRDAKLFIDAICGQNDPASCAHKIITSPSGLPALQSSLRIDTSFVFMNEHAILLLKYFQAPGLRIIESGSVLNRLLLSLVEPPFFWDSFVLAFRACTLSSEATLAFAWLLSHLVCLPGTVATSYIALAQNQDVQDLLLKSLDGEVRILGQRIKQSLSLQSTELHIDAEVRPGGRHDNDHADHRAISIMPTADELLSRERPFLRTADFMDDPGIANLAAIYLDNQFRLLREDMLGEIRNEIQILHGGKGRHKGIVIKELKLDGIDMGSDRKGRRPWGIILRSRTELPQLRKMEKSKRQAFLKDNKHILRHGNMACLLVDNEPVAFPTIERNVDELSKDYARIIVQLQDEKTLSYTLCKLKIANSVELAQLDTAVFAYEPFLKQLQEIRELPLADELLHWKEGSSYQAPSFKPTNVIEKLLRHAGKDVQPILGTEKSIILDPSQMTSLCSSLSRRVSLVQGPPGTGKSFIGALVAKVLHDYTSQVILVVCFTNHALDQFLEDLIDIGISSTHMVRLGGKSTDRTKVLTLREQGGSKLTPDQWGKINSSQITLENHENDLQKAFNIFSSNTSKQQILDYLEFADEDLPFYDAFSLPEMSGDEVIVGKGGKAVSAFYLLDRWTRGDRHAGAFNHLLRQDLIPVWTLAVEKRRWYQTRWQEAILSDLVEEVRRTGQDFNKVEAKISKVFAQRDTNVITDKRIIACTTNGAAKYTQAIQAASPGVVLVEEAGEILEAHILTAMGPKTEQLIMIGDHQQLRPKCSYELSIDGKSGYDLDRSLFERLVRKGFPHITLNKQHRMRPEISAIIRHMTYPDLENAETTLSRANVRGLRDNVIFINHSELEVERQECRELRDGNSTSSKQNPYEARMVLKCVRYLAQQGYGSDQIVVLTPYLGQLKLLRDELSNENDPILNDLDKFDLIRAGLLTNLGSKSSKPSLRISTIDNYQGEESDIVISSLTRSNKSHDIGFMKSPERLNVLISRARDGLILIGNSETFIHSRQGGSLWRKFMDHLKENDQIYEGLPVKCEKHPDRIALLSSPEDFDIHSPDGGCKEPCGTPLKCGIHKCPSSCHQLFDHSKMKCMFALTQKCPNGHLQTWVCYEGSAPVACGKCERDRKASDKRARKATEDQQKRDAKTQRHLQEVAKIQEDIDRISQGMKDARLDSEHENILVQKRMDLAAAQEMANRAKLDSLPQATLDPTSKSSVTSQVGADTTKRADTAGQADTAKQADTTKQTDAAKLQTTIPPPGRKAAKTLKSQLKAVLTLAVSPSKTEWQRQKDQENAQNPAIDSIMDMTGLEEVKSQVLRIKAKVETAVRQGTDLKKERLGLVLLGNPGTGKTTVARHYAQVLNSLQVLSGLGFVETTGSRLAHGGVKEVKDHLKTLEAAEGGVYFIDEAYQLAEGHNFGGKTVLDFLLAEIENLVGKVVFVFAGYRKQMEKFFEHNPGFSSRIPYTLHFEDYKDEELLSMLQSKMGKFYSTPMEIEDGIDGLYMRIVIRRLGRGRGKDGFGNARALENLFARIRERQSDRLTKQRRDGLRPTDNFISKEDLIGPDPSEAILKCEAWDKLQKLTGLKSVKESVQFMIELIKTNYMRELEEKPLIEVSLNRVFLGSPGTGKTTVAKLYGRILADIGLLSNGEVVTKNPADFIGSVIGQSEANTKAILATTVGKVLIIDEAYMLYSGSADGGTNATDMYKTAVIDTLVAEVQSVPGEDRCVLLLGYEDQMIQMFQNVNPGLTRRFQLSDAFRFEDFNDAELKEILQLKLHIQGLGATKQAVSTAIESLSRARNGLNFGNGGDVENMISKAKSNYQSRQCKLPVTERSIDFLFEPQDFDPNFDRGSNAKANLQDLFKDIIGCESIVQKLDGYLKVAVGMRAQGLEPRGQIPMNFIFKGPPGTGKTTVARKFGQVYYDLGFLSSAEVVECGASDLIGSYVGQTGPKTIKQLERGLGKVLFIDEAYRLGEGLFAQEAVNELVDTMTKPKFFGKLVIILAGYDNDMNNLLRVNEGLSSRFAEEIVFQSLSTKYCLELLANKVRENNINAPDLNNNQFEDAIWELSTLPGWGNARDIQNLAKSMVRAVYEGTSNFSNELQLSSEMAFRCIQNMLSERRDRSKLPRMPPSLAHAQVQSATHNQGLPSFNTTTIAEVIEEVTEGEMQPAAKASAPDEDTRDDGVPDAIWFQLQQDKMEAKLEAGRNENLIRDQEETLRAAEEIAKKLAAEIAMMAAIVAQQDAENLELLRQREEARIKEMEAKAEMERVRNELERQRKAIEEQRRVEAKAQAKLRDLGVCSAGFQWIKQGGGYRCAGGYHWVSNGELGM